MNSQNVVDIMQQYTTASFSNAPFPKDYKVTGVKEEKKIGVINKIKYNGPGIVRAAGTLSRFIGTLDYNRALINVCANTCFSYYRSSQNVSQQDSFIEGSIALTMFVFNTLLSIPCFNPPALPPFCSTMYLMCVFLKLELVHCSEQINFY